MWSDVEMLTWETADDAMHSDPDRECSSAEEEQPAQNTLHLCRFVSAQEP